VATVKVRWYEVGECDVFLQILQQESLNVLVGIGIVTEIVLSHLSEVMLKYTGDMGFRTTCNQKTKGVWKMVECDWR
jgi:hypothetical protein